MCFRNFWFGEFNTQKNYRAFRRYKISYSKMLGSDNRYTNGKSKCPYNFYSSEIKKYPDKVMDLSNRGTLRPLFCPSKYESMN